MKNLVQGLIKNRIIVCGLLLIYLLLGVLALRRLPIEAYPDVTNIQAQVITLWPGHAAEEVEKFVTIPVENQMNSLPQRASLRSVSLFGLSVVTITFEDDADNYRSRSLITQQLAQVSFPPGAQGQVGPDTTAVGEIYRYTLQAPPNFPPTELRAIEDFVVERQFRQVPGVVDVSGFGGPTKQYQVRVDPLKLKSYGLTLKNVSDALASSNQNAGGAYIEHGLQLLTVRGLGLIENLDDIRNTVLTVRNNVPITVGDLAEVRVGNQLRLGRVGRNQPDHGRRGPAETDQDDVVQGIVDMRKGDNVSEVLPRIKAKADEINRSLLPPGVRLVPHYDRTGLIERALHTVRHNTVEGILLVVAVLIAFLGVRNWRAALVVAAVIPCALLGAFMLLDVVHIPANLISMGAIDFGIIVDAAVVVIEIVIQLLEHRRQNGLSLVGAIVEGVSRMAKPILFSKVVLLVTFLPLYTLQRVEGRIFRPMALTLTFAIVVGVVLALVVVPCLASMFLRADQTGGGEEGGGGEGATAADGVPPGGGAAAAAGPPAHESKMGFGLVRLVRRGYEPLLDRALRRRWVVIGAAVGMLALTGLLATRLGSEFLPKLEEGSLWLHMNMPESTAPTEAARLVRQVRENLAAFPETGTIISQLGRPDDGTDVGGFNDAEISVDLIPVEQWKTARTRDELVARMNDRLRRLPNVEYGFSQYIEDNINEAVSGIKGELGIKVFGPDPGKLQQLADQIAAIVQEVPGARDAGPEHLSGQPQVQVRVDRRAVARYGLLIGDVDSLVETAFGGTVATQVLEGERSFDLAVKLREEAIGNLDLIRGIPLFGANNEVITLGQVADVGVHAGFARIYREENQRRIAVKFSVRGRDLGSVVADAQARVDARVKFPPGYRLEWTGSFENQQRAMRRLLVIVPVSLGLIFFILFSAFHSAKSAFLVLLNVPLAAIGGVVGLGLAGLPLSVSGAVGFVALFGIAIQDGVIMVTRIRELEDEGYEVRAAVKEGALSRLRPVLMTSIMAALGLLPAALSHAVGSETARPFAVVIVSGLVSSTLLTLIVLPVVSTFFLRRRPAAPPGPGAPPPPSPDPDQPPVRPAREVPALIRAAAAVTAAALLAGAVPGARPPAAAAAGAAGAGATPVTGPRTGTDTDPAAGNRPGGAAGGTAPSAASVTGRRAAGAQPLTFGRFLDQVLASNLDLAAQRFGVPLAQAQLVAAQVSPNPTLSGNFSHDISGRHQPTTYNAGLSETIENGGKRAARVTVAQKNLLAASATLADFLRTLRGTAASSYVDAAASQLIVVQKRRAFDSLNNLANLSQFRFAAGDLGEADANQARVDALQAQGDLLTAETTAQTNRYGLLQLLGAAAGAVPPSAVGELALPDRDFRLPSLVAGALERRPDVVAARQALAAAQAQIRLARANRYPDVTLSAGLQHNEIGRNPVDRSPPYNFVVLGASVPLPVFNSYRGEYLGAVQSAQQSAQTLRGTELRARVDVEQNYERYRRAKQRAAYYRGPVLQLAEKVLAARLAAYNQGGATLLDVLTAQRADTDVHLALIDALTERAKALIALEQAANIWDLQF